jgi:hypothetical protein
MTRVEARRLVAALAVTAASVAASPAGDWRNWGDRRPPDFVAQIATVSGIRSINLFVELYREDHCSLPPDLPSLFVEYGEKDPILDGWGREFHYYAAPTSSFYPSGPSYVLISYGRNGVPDEPMPVPGGLSRAGDWDADIVWVTDRFAQSPTDVDR